MNKYMRSVRHCDLDVYDVLNAWDVTCPAIAHAIKKLLMPGDRGEKDYVKDVQESIQALNRAIELQIEREICSNSNEKKPVAIKNVPEPVFKPSKELKLEDA